MKESQIKLKNLDKIRKANNMSVNELMQKLGKDCTTYNTWQKDHSVNLCCDASSYF